MIIFICVKWFISVTDSRGVYERHKGENKFVIRLILISQLCTRVSAVLRCVHGLFNEWLWTVVWSRGLMSKHNFVIIFSARFRFVFKYVYYCIFLVRHFNSAIWLKTTTKLQYKPCGMYIIHVHFTFILHKMAIDQLLSRWLKAL